MGISAGTGGGGHRNNTNTIHGSSNSKTRQAWAGGLGLGPAGTWLRTCGTGLGHKTGCRAPAHSLGLRLRAWFRAGRLGTGLGPAVGSRLRAGIWLRAWHWLGVGLGPGASVGTGLESGSAVGAGSGQGDWLGQGTEVRANTLEFPLALRVLTRGTQ